MGDGSGHKVSRQLRTLAVRGEGDPSGNPHGGDRRGDSPLWQRIEFARLTVCI